MKMSVFGNSRTAVPGEQIIANYGELVAGLG